MGSEGNWCDIAVLAGGEDEGERIQLHTRP
jgi:hypothetical protein